MTAAIGLTVAACAVATYFDVRARRIPNWLTGLLAAGALAVNGSLGLRVFLLSIAVMAVIMLLGTLLYSRGGVGGGDIKLAAAASGALSFPLCISFLLYTAIGGGLLAIGFIIVRGSARQSLARAAVMATGGAGAVTKSQSLPYAAAFTFGAILIALSQTVAPFLRILK